MKCMEKHTHTYWTTEQEDFLRANAATMPFKEIAVEVGKTRQAVANRVRKLGLSGRPYGARPEMRQSRGGQSPEAKERLAAYYRRRNASRADKKRMEITILKMKSGCVDCGYNEHPDALEWDHKDPATKVASISRLATWGRKFYEELAKCEVRCSNCHAIRSARQARERLGKPPVDVEMIRGLASIDV